MKIQKSKSMALLLVISSLSTLLLTTPALACTWGWTPGYWKNIRKHPWPTGYEPGHDFEETFGIDDPTFPDVTLLEALRGGGGPGILGAKKRLARSATAALLSQAALAQNGYLPSYVDWVRNRIIGNWDSDIGILQYWHDYFDALDNAGMPPGFTWP